MAYRVRKLRSALTIYRIADRRHPILSGYGAALLGGRWNSPGTQVIYACMTYEGALLEKLAHTNIGVIPPNQAAVEIDIPSGIAVATADIERLELNWWADLSYTRSLGDGWLADGKTVALIVPGAVAWPHQRNVLLNPDHRDFAKLTMGKLQPVRWDERLFGP